MFGSNTKPIIEILNLIKLKQPSIRYLTVAEMRTESLTYI